jgi:hypothetical protein
VLIQAHPKHGAIIDIPGESISQVASVGENLDNGFTGISNEFHQYWCFTHIYDDQVRYLLINVPITKICDFPFGPRKV